MPTTVHDFDWPDRVVVGTVGVPGQRTFYLQARAGKQLISIAMEKLQADQLAEKIDEILDQLMTIDGNPFHVPANTPLELVDNDDLDPVEEQFRAGVMSLGWDPTTSQVVIEAYPIEEVDEDDDGLLEDPDDADAAEVLRVRMPVGTAREVVGAGRPICVICGQPIDDDGHTCALPEN